MSDDDSHKVPQHEPDQEQCGEGRPQAPLSSGAAPASYKREPIFNKMPLGVAALTALILLVHIILLLAGQQATLIAHLNLGVSPLRLFSGIERQEWGSILLPLVAYQFMHGGTLHIMMNLAMLLQAGPVAELGFGGRRNGVVRFIAFFIVSGIGGALMYCVLNPSSQAPTIGASGAISGVFSGFLWAAIGLAKPGRAMLRPVLVSAALFLLINVGLAWVGRVMNVVPIAWESHLGGFLTGLVFYPLFARAGRSGPQ